MAAYDFTLRPDPLLHTRLVFLASRLLPDMMPGADDTELADEILAVVGTSVSSNANPASRLRAAIRAGNEALRMRAPNNHMVTDGLTWRDFDADQGVS